MPKQCQMTGKETTVSIEGAFWRVIHEIARCTGKSKRRILWEMAEEYLISEDKRSYLEYEGVSVNDLLEQIRASFNEALSITV